MHNDFTLFSRVVPSGKTVVYYYAYDSEGKRLGPWTTGQTTMTAGRNYCNLLNRKGKLLPELKGMPTFTEFSALFWDWEKSEYLKERRKRRKLTQSYTDKNKKTVENIFAYSCQFSPLVLVTCGQWFLKHSAGRPHLKNTIRHKNIFVNIFFYGEANIV